MDSTELVTVDGSPDDVESIIRSARAAEAELAVLDHPPAPQEDIRGDDTEALVEAVVPYFPDDSRKSKYLSFRTCGFTVMESIHFSGVGLRTVKRWRADDDDFKRLDSEGMTELRSKLGNHFLELEFKRNYRLILEKDYMVLSHAVRNEPMSEREYGYLMKVRHHYTPQQLETLETLIGAVDNPKDFDWTEMVLAIRNRGGSMTIAARRGEG